MEEILLKVKNLHTDFITEDKTVQAVNNVSFEIKKGETFGLIGESGCGKSVTCRSLIRLIKEPGKITGGEIIYKGENLLEYSEKQMQKIRGSEIGMIFQDPMTTLNPVLTIKQQLTEAIKDKNMSRKQKENRAEELLKLVGIPSAKERLSNYPHQFSGGMRQRAMIAIALASNPHLLLADEPTTALDVTIQDQIIKLLKRLKKELDMSLVLVTHDLGVAAQMCDHIAVMYAGRIMETADAQSIFESPRNPYTYGLMRAIPSIDKKGEELYTIEGAPPNLDDMPTGCPFSPRCEFCEKICKEKVPELVEVEPGHFSRCHCLDKMKNIKGRVEKEEGGMLDV